MWNGLMFGLASLFTAQADLPTVDAMQQEVAQFAQVYEINTDRIHVLESTMNNPSPFLTNSGIKTCVLHVNHHGDAKRVWSHFVNTQDQNLQAAFLAFTSAHELTHCLMSEKGKRTQSRKALEAHLGITFKNNTHFEETLADLVGLAYLEKVAPHYFEPVLNRLRTIRTDFSKRDPEHDSSQALQANTIAFADRMLIKRQHVQLVQASAR
jgi:hypothetical protein